MKWQFLNTGSRRGKFNMEYDEFLATKMLEGKDISTLRVYGWNPPAISLGYNQKIEEIDLEKCLAEGIDVVRRPTGGRAILHWNELTYSVVMFSKNLSTMEVYEKVSRALVEGIRLLGVDVELEKSQPNFQNLYKDKSSVSCFSSSAKFEIQYKKKKLVGSAQRRYSNKNNVEVVLQHGSILLGPEHKLIVDFLSEKNIEVVNTIKKNLDERTTNLKTILNRDITFEEVAECIKAGFEKYWNIKFHITGQNEEQKIFLNE